MLLPPPLQHAPIPLPINGRWGPCSRRAVVLWLQFWCCSARAAVVVLLCHCFAASTRTVTKPGAMGALLPAFLVGCVAEYRGSSARRTPLHCVIAPTNNTRWGPTPAFQGPDSITDRQVCITA